MDKVNEWNKIPEIKTWMEIMEEYKSDITEDEANYILWNETCYPFDDKTTLIQIQQFFTKK